MKILIDIGHPAHAHLFKNFSWIMQEKGHKILFTVKDKECCRYLLDKYGFEYVLSTKARPCIFGKILSLCQGSLKTLQVSKKFEPDLFLSHGSIAFAFVSRVIRKPHISMEDTGNLEQIFLYKPFTDVILSPKSLKLNLGKKHIKYQGYHELAYLHPKYFNPDRDILRILGVKEKEKFVVIRFSAQAATHDFGHRGLPLEYKIRSVEEFSKHAKVFISSESHIEPCLEKFIIKIPPEKMHDAIYYASLVYSEGAKSASEAAILGTPAIFVSFKPIDYIQEQSNKYESVFCFNNSAAGCAAALRKGMEILQHPAIKEKWRIKRNKIVHDNIDVTAFVAWFVENYPGSTEIIKNNPEYQFGFK